MSLVLSKSIKREIRLHEVDVPVVLTIGPNGIEMAVSGFRQKIFSSWDQVARSCQTPNDVQSYLAGDPLGVLKRQADKHKKKQ